MSKSDYLENELLDHSLAVAPYTAPTTIYLALYTSNPGEANTGTEVSGNGYARQSVTFGAASGGSSSSTSSVDFIASGGDWGTITHTALFDSLTNGNMLYYNALNASQVVNDGGTLSFAAGALTVAEG